MTKMNLKKYIRPGRKAADITPLLENAAAFHALIEKLSKLFLKEKVDKIASIEGRGFLLGSAVAYNMGVGLVPIRIKGKLQNDTYKKKFTDYSRKEKIFEIHKDAVQKGDSIVIIDDWLETGGSVKTAIELVERCGGSVIGIGIFMDDSKPETKKYLEKYNYKYIDYVTPEDNF